MYIVLIVFLTGIASMFASLKNNMKLVKVSALVGLLFAFSLLFTDLNENIESFKSFFFFSPYSQLFTCISIVLTALIFLNFETHSNDSRKKHFYEFFPLILFSLCGAIILFSFTSLISLYLGVEIMSIPLYILASGYKSENKSLEAGLKYFILGSFSSAIMLFAMALIYGGLGEFSVVHIHEKLAMLDPRSLPPFFYVGIAMFAVSMFFKVSSVPFHFWSPDVYEGSPTLVTSYMASVVKLASAVTVFYFFKVFFWNLESQWSLYFLFTISLTFIVGNIAAYWQKSVKRMLAYSSIANAGFLLLSILIAAPGRIDLLLLFATAYVFASAGTFLIVEFTCEESNDFSFDAFNGLFKTNPFLATMLSFFLFSMAGIPLTAGFVAKYIILTESSVNQPVLFILALIASAISIFYYLSLFNRMAFSPSSEKVYPGDFKKPIFITSLIIIIILILMSFITDTFFNSMLNFSHYIKINHFFFS
jgi:NADH-quinone oxidoreductase subunit N